MFACLSQSNGIATAFSTSSSSIFAQALRLAGSALIDSAAVIAALILGMFVWPQFTLPVDTMDLPLNVMLSTVCGSAKSAIQPTLGHTSISSLGTLQYFAYIVAVSTSVNFVVKPRFLSVWLTLSASCSAGFPLEQTIVTVSPPENLPFGYPAR